MNGEDYSALDIEFGSSDDDAGVLGEKLPAACDDKSNHTMDIKDERGSDVEGKFSSDDGEDVEGEFSDDGDNGGGDGIADHRSNVKLHGEKTSQDESLGQIRKDILGTLEQLKRWVSKAEDGAQLQSLSNELSFYANCILLPKN